MAEPAIRRIMSYPKVIGEMNDEDMWNIFEKSNSISEYLINLGFSDSWRSFFEKRYEDEFIDIKERFS